MEKEAVNRIRRTPSYFEVCSNRPPCEEWIRMQIEHFKTIAGTEDAVAIEKGKTMRIAVYIRIGNDNCFDRDSVDLQVQYYTEQCKALYGAEPAEIYVDVGYGLNTDRPGFQRLLADCRAGKIDKVITKNVSRFSRSLPDLIDTVKELKDLGVTIRFEIEGVDTENPDGEMMFQLLEISVLEDTRRAAYKRNKRRYDKDGNNKNKD